MPVTSVPRRPPGQVQGVSACAHVLTLGQGQWTQGHLWSPKPSPEHRAHARRPRGRRPGSGTSPSEPPATPSVLKKDRKPEAGRARAAAAPRPPNPRPLRPHSALEGGRPPAQKQAQGPCVSHSTERTLLPVPPGRQLLGRLHPRPAACQEQNLPRKTPRERDHSTEKDSRGTKDKSCKIHPPKQQNGSEASLSLITFFFFCFLGLHPQHMKAPRLGVQSELQLLATPQPQQRGIRARSATYTTAPGNV